MIWNETVRNLNQNRWMNEKRTLRSQKQILKKQRFFGACVHGWETWTHRASFWETLIGARGPSIHLLSWTEWW